MFDFEAFVLGDFNLKKNETKRTRVRTFRARAISRAAVTKTKRKENGRFDFIFFLKIFFRKKLANKSSSPPEGRRQRHLFTSGQRVRASTPGRNNDGLHGARVNYYHVLLGTRGIRRGRKRSNDFGKPGSLNSGTVVRSSAAKGEVKKPV